MLKIKLPQASLTEILVETDDGASESVPLKSFPGDSDANGLLQGQGNAALHHISLSPTPQGVQGRWHLSHFTDEVKGLTQGHTLNAWQWEQCKDKTEFLVGENSSRAFQKRKICEYLFQA